MVLSVSLSNISNILSYKMGCRRLLLSRSADTNSARTDDGTTALHMASARGHLGVVRLLLDGGALPDTATTDKYGQTALYIASQARHILKNMYCIIYLAPQLLPPAAPYYPIPTGNIHTRSNTWSFTVG